MKLYLLSALCLLCGYGFGQNSCWLKLVDAYSYQQIDIDTSFVVNKRSTVDTCGNLIQINHLWGKKLKISSNDYMDFEQKIFLKKYRNDTLVLQLKPKEVVAQSRFHAMWTLPGAAMDTLHFADKKALEKHILSYLNHVIFLADECGDGLCSYSNTYYYDIQFTEHQSVFSITRLVKTRPSGYSCEALEKQLELFPAIFPKFRLGDKSTVAQMNFIIYRD